MAKPSDLYLPGLRLWRAMQGMTQEDLAEKAGVARGTILRAENGGGISILSAVKIAKALDITLQQLQQEPPDA